MARENDILEYAKGKRRGKKANCLERESLHDPFLADALEGFEQVGQHGTALADLRRRLHFAPATQRRRYFQNHYVLAIAAVVLLILVIAPMFYSTFKHEQLLAMRVDIAQAALLEEGLIPVTLKGPTQAAVIAEVLSRRPVATDVLDREEGMATIQSEIAADEKDNDNLLLADIAASKEKKEDQANDKSLRQKNNAKEQLTKPDPVVAGKVVDENGKALSGVVITQSDKIIFTDTSGKFSISITDFDKQLTASSLSYKTMIIPIRDSSKSLLVTMIPNQRQPDEVVLTGYAANRNKKMESAKALQNDDSLRERALQEEEIIPFALVEEKPLFMNGDLASFSEWVQKHLKYPEEYAESAVQGKIFVSFIITAEGKISAVKIVRGLDPLIDKEVVRVVSSSPLWTPAKQHGKAVSVSCTLSIKIEI